MGLQKSEYACPTCKRVSGRSSQINGDMGRLVCSVDSNHVWVDIMSFLAERPTMEFKVEVAKNLPQENYTPMTVSVPIGLQGALETKYGEKLMATVAGILKQMLEGNILIVGQTDLDRLSGKLGKVPSSSGELYGMVFTLAEQVTEAKQIADAASKDLKAYEGLSVGRVLVDLGDQYQEAVERARGADLPLKLWAEQSLKNGIRDAWF